MDGMEGRMGWKDGGEGCRTVGGEARRGERGGKEGRREGRQAYRADQGSRTPLATCFPSCAGPCSRDWPGRRGQGTAAPH